MPLSFTGIGVLGTTATGEKIDVFDDEFGGVLSIPDAIALIARSIKTRNYNWTIVNTGGCVQFDFYDFKVDTKKPVLTLPRSHFDDP